MTTEAMTPLTDEEEEDDFIDSSECWNCGGEGCVAHCFEEFACIDPEGGCDDCIQTCDICRGTGALK